jgi:hypothetical protein
MSYYLDHPEFFNGPIRLTKEEINDPLEVVSSFFEDYSLSEIRDHNEQMDHVCLSTDSPPFEESSERDHLLCYRQDEERVLEAAFLLSRKSDSSAKMQPSETPPEKTLRPLIGEINLTDVQKRIVEIQHKVAQLCRIVADAYGSSIEKLLKS